jgi:hypothetical protein
MQRRSFLAGSAAALNSRGGARSSTALGFAARVHSLDGEWKLTADGRTAAVRVPGAMQEAFPAWHGAGVYEREFIAPRHPDRDGRYLLQFGAVDYLAEVSVNGQAVGRHENGETPFTLDVTAAVRAGAANVLRVRVINPTNQPIDGLVLKEVPHRNKEVPFRPGAFYNEGGIIESVNLVLAPPVRIEDVFVRADWEKGVVRIEATLHNATGRAVKEAVEFLIAPAMASHRATVSVGAGRSELVTASVTIPGHRLWSLADPFLYTAHVRSAHDEGTVRFGFRDFRVRDGYFHLNGKRIFLKSTHTGNHAPIGQIVAPTQVPDILRRDMLLAKTSGYNTVRFIAGVAHPDQLDLCDEIGLMVYQEPMAGWELADSPQMSARYERAVLEMVKRDRNHPSMTIWGMLNETKDGPVFRKAVATLKPLREIDDTRLVLLSSGRWDCQPAIGSVSNPGSAEWEHVWGKEAPGATATPNAWNRDAGGYFQDAGDAHAYPGVPQTPKINAFIRNLGRDTKPVFLSEYGIGSLFDAVRNARMFEQVGADPALEDFALARSMAQKLEADWKRFGMDGVYAFPEDLLRASQKHMARQRGLGFDLVRSNPKLCGFNVTGMLDHVMTGEGLWGMWRDWKPGIADVLQDGWAPLRWCLFADPAHGYAGRPVHVEAVLANEDVLAPGEYPARFRIMGPQGVAWERRAMVRVGANRPLAVPVLDEQVTIAGPAGVYQLAAQLERGGSPRNECLTFRISDPVDLGKAVPATFSGIDAGMGDRLRERGYRNGGADARIVVVGKIDEWSRLRQRVENEGVVAVLVDPASFAKLPFAKMGRCYNAGDWLYHKECVARRHRLFEGLDGPGLMNWEYYGPAIARYVIDPKEDPEDTAALSFAVGITDPSGYRSGVLAGAYRMGRGWVVFSTFGIAENVGLHPAADGLFVNLLGWAGALGERSTG